MIYEIRDSVDPEGPTIGINLSIGPLLCSGFGFVFWYGYECEVIHVDRSWCSRMKLVEVVDCLI